MDLRFAGLAPSAAEQAALDDLLGRPIDAPAGHWRGNGALGQRRHLLLPALHAVHDAVGWISRGAVDEIARRLEVAPADVFGVASFYGLFSLEPRPPRVVHVCTDLACRIAGSEQLVDGLSSSENAAWSESPCLGVCERAPAALVTQYGEGHGEAVVAPASPSDIVHALTEGLGGLASEPDVAAAVPQVGEPSLMLLRRVGVVDPISLDDYRSHGGYEALRRAVKLGPAGVIREVTDSGLVGRGGAAFPTGRKWAAVAGQPVRPHELICNADESEPGTFKDRVLMEGDPYSVLEAMTIAGYATGAEHGYLYIRGEYPRALHALRAALDTARERGFLGPNVMGLGFAFDVEIRRGAGAYICGEETAIFNSIEGYRGEPRNKPPFPVEVGLFGRPTLVNNVETLVNVLPILTGGSAAYAAIGTARSTGPKLFCLSGAVVRPGVYEVPFGTTLHELLDLAGGLPPGRSLRAVLLGGAAGAFVAPHGLDVPLTFEGAVEAGVTLGSGVVMVLDDTVELAPFLLRIAAFFRDESCGQCVPCRVGTVRQEEALVRLTSGRPMGGVDDELALLADIGQVMQDASICGLGQTAASAIASAIKTLSAFGGER
ncbi:MAG TPA: NAD(P)H-dependent oxidoreductase subunit E [Acidimicrobiia bacterium]|jgi:NADH-quinone oxidoreductase subunit F|nr:NAD(P)H-dependent oxidoreductase subunit E [Acidimicrobiia bacterium]